MLSGRESPGVRVLTRGAGQSVSGVRDATRARPSSDSEYGSNVSRRTARVRSGASRIPDAGAPAALIPKQSGAILVQAEVSRDFWNALVRYRGEQEIQLGREYSMSEALTALLGKALGIVPPPE